MQSLDMKSILLVVCALALAAVVVQGQINGNGEGQGDEVKEWDATDSLEKMQDEAEDASAADSAIIEEDLKKPSKPVVDAHGCDCGKECDKLHYSILPKEVRDPHSYLSYENYPVLCRDAAALLLSHKGGPKKKYVCKSVFNCCRYCNFHFYVCLRNSSHYSFGFCVRGAYKCMCDCVDRKGHNELKYLPVPH